MTTLYDKVREDLLEKIRTGAYPEGETIPSEPELAQIYGVSRATIRQALQILSDEGYVEKRRRRGTIVTKPKVDQSFTLEVSSFEDAMRTEGRLPRTNVILFRAEIASEEVARKLGLSGKDKVYKLVRLRYVDDQPNVFVESYVPCAPYPGLDGYDFNEESLYAAMDACGEPVASARRRFEAIRAEGAATTLLDVEAGDPLILFHTIGYDAAGRPVEYSIARYRGASNSFEISVTR
ncbi:MAG: GntR family transcriptional regulator [Atopobiaceae bacterium]|uniref:GntR family transcriptional regulator n=1 Tax=Paratractidigestivibacter sp. TaxID=2847316 RepID=UPI000D79E226|nr:GntR family transcriptional regulator [Atopobiaceae bacterium]PWM29789.1 MAG: GntR family transcriptional regulator [Coriobacteriia bacterium]